MPPPKQEEINALIVQVKQLVATATDLTRQVSKYIRVDNDLAERYARSMEELDALRLAQEEQRELLADYFQEQARWTDRLDKSLRELQRYIILIRAIGGNQETVQIESKFVTAQIEDALREELANQQNLLAQYQKNVAKVKMSIARYGETVPLMNELEEYETKLDKANEAIARIRQSLAA